MEKISASSAMDWSIALEKSLRSKIPGKSVEGILVIGQNLERWCFEPESQMTAYNMYGLVPGEERLFANTILLRLADAFMSGEMDVKIAVVRVFRSLRRMRKRMKMSNKVWMLSKQRVSNASELLKRVKVVFDCGNAELRSMALVIFGCWADFSKDSAHVRYLILSSMVSSEELEVKASLFAAGCFCELSDDFASVALHMLGSLLMSSDIPSSIRLAGARALSKMKCSLSIMNMAYKTGLELVLSSPEEELLSTMVCSMSILACKSPTLVSKQANLLFTLLTEGESKNVRRIALKCLYNIFELGVCHFLVVTQIKALVDIVNDPALSSWMQCTALRILYQVRFHLLPSWSLVSMPDFSELLKCFVVASQSRVRSKSLLSIRILASLALSLDDNKEPEDDGIVASLPARIITSIFGKISLLLKPLSHVNSAIISEVRVMLNLLLHLAGRHPNLSVLVLDEITLLTGCLLNEVDLSMSLPRTMSGNDVGVSKDKETRVITSNVIISMCRDLTVFLRVFNDSNQFKVHVLERLKFLTQRIQQSDLLTSHVKAICLLLMSSQTVWTCMRETQLDEQIVSTLDSFFMDCECSVVQCVLKMVAEKEYWLAYNAGICAACQGAWLVPMFVFENLRTMVHSELNRHWIEALLQFSIAEMLQQLVIPSTVLSWKECLERSEISLTIFSGWVSDTTEEGTALVHDTSIRNQKLLEAYSAMISSYKTVKTETSSGGEFLFQSWFLALKKKLLETIAGLLMLLVSIPPGGDMANNNVSNGHCRVECTTFMHDLILVSSKLQSLSREFDLLAASLIGLDKSSHKTISALAFGCSVMSFGVGFAFFIPDVPGISQMLSTYDSRQFSRAVLLQNLLGRLPYLNEDTNAIFSSLLDDDDWTSNFSPLPSKIQLADTSCEARPFISLFYHILSRVMDLRKKVKDMRDELFFEFIQIGQGLLMNIMEQWFRIHFPAPKCFFRIRPWMGAELFAINADPTHPEGISISRGWELSLNLSLQLRNPPSDLPIHRWKFHTIIHCSPSFQVPETTEETSFQVSDAWESGDLVDLNERLFHNIVYVGEGNSQTMLPNGDHTCDGATGFVSFEVSESGVGFSNCLIDVSGFPVGKFRMKWHSCFIDSDGSYWSLLPLNPGPVFTVV